MHSIYTKIVEKKTTFSALNFFKKNCRIPYRLSVEEKAPLLEDVWPMLPTHFSFLFSLFITKTPFEVVAGC